MYNKHAHIIAFVLVMIGGLNWGLHALGYNAVNMVLGAWPTVETVVYALVGISALYLIVSHKGTCTMCK